MAESEIFCFHCDQNVGQKLLTAEENSKRDKLLEQFETIIKVAEKLGEKVESPEFVLETRVKKEKKEAIKEQYKMTEKGHNT